MKAELNGDGTLVVRGETGLEKYALSKWLEDWDKKQALLIIEHRPPHAPEAVVATVVDPLENSTEVSEIKWK